MAEYIEREALLEALKEFRLNETMSKHLTREDCETARNAVERAQMVIERIPATDVAPVQHGRWIDNGACGYKWAFACSKCGYIDGYPFNDRHNYCPNCGARMTEDIRQMPSLCVAVDMGQFLRWIRMQDTVAAVPVSELLSLRDNLYEDDLITMRGLRDLNMLIAKYEGGKTDAPD